MQSSLVAKIENLSPGTIGYRALRQTSCRLTAAAQSILLLALVIAIVLPVVALTAQAIAEPATRARIAAEPLPSAGAATGIAIWLLMFGVPAIQAIKRLRWSRDIVMTPETVAVSERTFFRQRAWAEPLKRYSGLTHHVRTTLSATHHELILVHPDPSRSLVLVREDLIDRQKIDAVGEEFGLQVLATSALLQGPATADESPSANKTPDAPSGPVAAVAA